MKIKLLRSDLDYTLGSVAWIIYHGHEELTDHQRHQIADICQGENRHLVTRMLWIALAELCGMMSGNVRYSEVISVDGEAPSGYELEVDDRSGKVDASLFREQVHGYLVWRVMRQWLALWLAGASSQAGEKEGEYLSKLRASFGRRTTCRRRLPPIA